MEKKKIFWIVLTIVIAVITLAIIINLVLKSDKFNEGKFRVNDAVLVSSAEVENRTENNGTWSISLSQKNKLGLLITPAAKAEIDRIYLTDITVNKGSVVFSQANSENKLNLTYDKQDLDI